MKRIKLLFVFLCTLTIAYGQVAEHLSLNQILAQVESNYPSILQYQENIRSLEAKAEGTNSWMPPVFSTGLMRFPYSLSTINSENDPMNQAGISYAVEQMIPNPTKLNAKREYLLSMAEIEKNKSAWLKNVLCREAKILYYKRFISERKQGIIKESEEILNILLTTAEIKFSNNQSQLQTIYKAKARLAEIKNMQLMLESLIAESNIGLNTLLLRDINTAFTVDTMMGPKKYYTTGDSIDYSDRSDIQAISGSIETMRIEQSVMKTSTRPDFGVRIEHMQMFGMPNQWSVMGMMIFPLVPWSSKMYRSEIKSLEYQIQGMELEKQSMSLMAKRMVSEKQSMLYYETKQYEMYKAEIIPAFENNLQVNMLAYNQNTGTLFVVLDAWEMLLMKKLEAYDKLFNILKLEAEYEYENEIR